MMIPTCTQDTLEPSSLSPHLTSNKFLSMGLQNIYIPSHTIPLCNRTVSKRELEFLGEKTRMVRRSRDAEAELKLPPGFRFHPTDEELVLHYLCRMTAHQFLPVSIIAEVDIYKYDPWQLPEKALFGKKEWYFFTPRDRKYPNGSRPNRAAGSGYWKATGADKMVTPEGSSRPLGIKKALVFYAGKAPKGVKTNWIMHEYRLAQTTRPTTSTKDSLRLDDWVLCRLYNKKNDWEREKQQTRGSSFVETIDSFGSPSSDVDNGEYAETTAQNNCGIPSTTMTTASYMGAGNVKDDEWFMDLKLDDLQNTFLMFDGTDGGKPAMDTSLYQDCSFSGIPSPLPKFSHQNGLLPF